MHIRILAGLLLVVWYATSAMADEPKQERAPPELVEPAPHHDLLCGIYTRLELLTGFSHSNTKGDNRLAFRARAWGFECGYQHGNWKVKFSEGLRSEDYKLSHWDYRWMGNLSVAAQGFETLIGVGRDLGNWNLNLSNWCLFHRCLGDWRLGKGSVWAEIVRQEVDVDTWRVDWLGFATRHSFSDFSGFANDHVDLGVYLKSWKFRVKGELEVNRNLHLGLGFEWGILRPGGNIIPDDVAELALKHNFIDSERILQKLRENIHLVGATPEARVGGERWSLSTRVLWGKFGQEDWVWGADLTVKLSF
ncbi:MAG: hypothetical protein HYT15_04000 [Candidatus Magasanikbacteria bacterium]|nr:hypothetical protein [Candidatus Magasanikbacteria bacterium]